MRSEKEKENRRNYKKKHPKPNRKHNKTYRARHTDEIAEYMRLNPELRVRLPLATHEGLKRLFGEDIPGGIKGLIARELEVLIKL
jgi:hypothetical protein